MKKLPGEVYFFVVGWLAIAPAVGVYFAASIIYVKVKHIDPSQIGDFAFLWPVMVISFLTLFLVMQLAAYSKFRTGFFSAWLEMVFGEITAEGLYERGRQARLDKQVRKSGEKR
ncbi:hypothetical protein [Rhizobium ruizarguesonis]|uniref:hypothetical protein n=1 Tax=Rhizobium ruizarguesonis TaxID=2081791 RepID=UPI001CF26A4C|nr:hypothetical protein [Rhizobium ruizarguesonis]MCB2400426.1 hypothetical protein [Rhizobium ruizarguesonis]